MIAAAAAAAPGVAGAAQLIGGSYQLEYNQDVDTKGAEVTEVTKFKQILEVKFKGLMSPVVANEVTFRVEQEVNSNAADTLRLLPMVDLAFKGKYWDAKAGVKRTEETSNEPGRNPKTTDNWYAEFFYLAPPHVPDLKAKYTLDTDFEEGTIDQRKQGIVLSSLYKPNDWLEFKGDYSRDTMDDRLNPNSDTEEEKSAGAVAVRRMFSPKLKAEAQYSVEIDRGATLVEAGGSTSTKEDQTHKVKSMVSFRPFRNTSFDGSYDYELKQNKVLGEHTLTTNIKATAEQKILKPFDVKGEFLRIVTENRHTVDDYTKTEDTKTLELKAWFSKQLDFSLRRQDKHTVEDHTDVTRSQTYSTLNDTVTWTGEMARFWKASASYDRLDTYTWNAFAAREEKTMVDTKYSLKSTFDFKAVNLALEPTYDIALKDDRLKPAKTETRDFKFKVAYKILSTRTVEARVDHTYGRKRDTLARNIQRQDSTNGNVTWTDPIPGWVVAFDLTRTATDTSQDDLPPDITSTFGVKLDYKYQWLALNTSYKYDKKSLTDDGETFDAKVGWAAPRWDVSMTYTFTKVFSVETDEKYSITLSFKYNL